MRFTMIAVATLICLAGALAFASQQAQSRTWSGFLVGSGCYEALERNTNPWDTSTYVDRDRNWEVQYCAPNAKTKSFTLVDRDGLSHKLDSESNVKAAGFVQQTGKRVPMAVTVSGEQSEKTMQVDSISAR